MILVDSSVWMDHLRQPDVALAGLITAGQVFCHPYVIGELAMGSMKRREQFLAELTDMPSLQVAQDEEVLRFIEVEKLYGRGIGYIDAHLLASTLLTAGSTLWSRDRRLAEAARAMKVAHAPAYLH